MQDDDDDDDIRGLDLEALEQEAVAEATSRSELAGERGGFKGGGKVF